LKRDKENIPITQSEREEVVKKHEEDELDWIQKRKQRLQGLKRKINDKNKNEE
jgi:hypothetical protein